MTIKHLLAAAVIAGLSYLPGPDGLFFPIALLGPLATGVVVGLRGGHIRAAALTWGLVGLVWPVTDWIVNTEDQLFHALLACVMAGLVLLGAMVAVRRPGRRQGSPARAR